MKFLSLFIAGAVLLQGLPAEARYLTVWATKGRTTVFGNGRNVKARLGTKLRQRDQIITSRGSSIQLDFNQGSVTLTGSSRLYVTRLTTKKGGMVTRLHLYRGNIWLNVRKFNNPYSSLVVTTPNGIIYNVKGTHFGVKSEGLSDVLAVNEGYVFAQAGSQKALISSGYGLVGSRGKLSQPVATYKQTQFPELTVKRNSAFSVVKGRIANYTHLVGKSQFIENEPENKINLQLNNKSLEVSEDGEFSTRVRNPLLDNDVSINGYLGDSSFRKSLPLDPYTR